LAPEGITSSYESMVDEDILRFYEQTRVECCMDDLKKFGARNSIDKGIKELRVLRTNLL